MSKNLAKRDYVIITFIGICLAFFTVPIIRNVIDPTFLKVIYFPLYFVIWVLAANVGLLIAGIISEKIPVFLQISKFVAVGVFNTFLDWGIVNGLIFLLDMHGSREFVIFKTLSFLIANVASFFWNKSWTFQVSDESSSKDYIQFLVVSAIGLLINVGVAYLTKEMKPELISEGLWTQVSLLMATVFSMVWNFLGYKFIVFKSS